MVREEKDVKTESEWRLRSFLLSQNNRMLKDAKDLLNEGRLKKKKWSRRVKREIAVRKILVMMWTFISMKGSRAQPSSWEEMRVKQQALAFYGLAGKGRVRVYSQMLSKKNAPAQTLVTETSTMSILTQTSPQIQMLELRVSPAMSFQVWWGECEQSIISAVPASLANCGHRS